MNHMHRVTSLQQPGYPRHKLRGRQSSGWLGQELIVLRYRNVDPRMHVQTDLDDRTGKFYPVNGDLE